MSSFRFQLATLLRLREVARDRCRVQLAESRRADAELVERLEQLDAQRNRLQAACREAAGPGAVDMAELLEAHCYAVALRAQEAEWHRRRETLAIEIEHRRQSLIAADRDARVLEKLRDRRHEEYRLDEERQAAKLLDEVALQMVER